MSERASFDFFLDAAELPPDDMPVPTGPAIARGPKVDKDGTHKRAPSQKRPKPQRSQGAQIAKLLPDTEMIVAQVEETTCIPQQTREAPSSISLQPPNEAVLEQPPMISFDEQSSGSIRAARHDTLEGLPVDKVLCEPPSPQLSSVVAPVAVEMPCEAGTDVAAEITPQRKKRAMMTDSFSITPPRNDCTNDVTCTSKVGGDGKISTCAFMQSNFPLKGHASMSRKRMRTKGPAVYIEPSTLSVAQVEHNEAQVASLSYHEKPTSNEMFTHPSEWAMVPYKRPAGGSPPRNRSGPQSPRTPALKNSFYESLRGTQLEEVVFTPTKELEGGRPKRRRIPPVEFWRGEQVIYERLLGSNELTMTGVIYNTAGGVANHQLAILDRDRMPALKDKPRLKALKDKCRR
mmetsp:Transcript_15084/g.23819  ORF Transcript_15084/g.23819 Transcript_15084/m.23819 type:complete len:403 (-) Transcript_15084:28-1236(-)